MLLEFCLELQWFIGKNGDKQIFIILSYHPWIWYVFPFIQTFLFSAEFSNILHENLEHLEFTARHHTDFVPTSVGSLFLGCWFLLGKETFLTLYDLVSSQTCWTLLNLCSFFLGSVCFYFIFLVDSHVTADYIFVYFTNPYAFLFSWLPAWIQMSLVTAGSLACEWKALFHHQHDVGCRFLLSFIGLEFLKIVITNGC